MDVQINQTDIFCQLNRNYDAVYNALRGLIRDEKEFIFAERKQGAGYFIWRHSGNDWVKLSDFEPVEKETLRSELMDIEGEIKRKIKTNPVLATMAENIFVVPDDSHILVNNGLEGPRFLLVAWGYKYPLGAAGGMIEEGNEESNKQDVSLSFTYAGDVQTNVTFTLGAKASANNKEFIVDSSGKAHVGPLNIGSTYSILYVPYGKVLKLDIVKGQSEYMLDVTRTASVNVSVKKDGDPVPCVQCQIDYAACTYPFTLDTEGNGRWNLILVDGDDNATVIAEGESKTIRLIEGENDVRFSFETPAVQPEPVRPSVVSPTVLVTDSTGEAMSAYDVNVICNGAVQAYVTDGEGKILLPPVEIGTDITVEDSNDASNTASCRISNESDVCHLVIPIAEGRVDGKEWDCELIVRNWTGFRIKEGSILYQQPGHKDILAQIDTKGRTYLCYKDFRIDDTITANINVPGVELDPVPFSLSRDHQKYVFKIRKITFWTVLLYILLALLIIGLVVGIIIMFVG